MLIGQDVQALIKMSKLAGGDPKMVQGGGGNTSVKSPDGKRLHVKTSGTALKNMTHTRGWVTLHIHPVVAPLDDPEFRRLTPQDREARILDIMMASRCGGEPDGRPSVEAALHACMPGKCILHTHPTVLNGILCSKKAEAGIKKMAKVCGQTPLFIPYTDPGYPLAVAVWKAMKRYRADHNEDPVCIFIESHGLFVSADTPQLALKRTRKILAESEKLTHLPRVKAKCTFDPAEIAQFMNALRGAIAKATDSPPPMLRLFESPLTAHLLERKDAKTILPRALTPDDMVYCGLKAAIADPRSQRDPAGFLARFMDKHPQGETPKLILLPGVGYIGVGAPEGGSFKAIQTIHEVCESHIETIARSLKFGGPKPLSKRSTDYLGGWEVPQYRKTVAKAGAKGKEAPCGGLTGKIALVTGAGSGLGRAIALGLVQAGAAVGLFDIDARAAHETGELIADNIGAGKTLVCSCDVTDETSVVTAMEELTLTYGGLDICVCAAGIAPAGPLTEFSLAAWRKTLEINLTGYFLIGRQAARVMTSQDCGGSIVLLSSKSGLEASKANSAYNATKAGEIHLARGWAKELGEKGIRVNAVAPGNVFEGSKIWNPKYIKTVAAKRGIKPEQVIPYYINLTTLKRDVTGSDVADAVIFLCSDHARVITGQTLVCDAGQVFVR